MTRTLRSALVLVALAVSAVPLTGCVVTNNADGSTTLEGATRFNGTPAPASVGYTAGQAVSIVSHNGNVTVHPGSGSSLAVTFTPFTMDKGDQGTRAASEMAKYLVFNAKTNGNVIDVEAVINQGASGLLGADIDVALPPSFNGAFQVTSANGQVDADLGGTTPSSTNVAASNGEVKVSSAQGKLNVTSGNGAVDVDVAAWSATEDGTVTSQNGNVDIKIPTATNGALTATATGVVTASNLPSSWAEAVAAPNSKSYTMGSGGAKVALSTSLGDVTITAK